MDKSRIFENLWRGLPDPFLEVVYPGGKGGSPPPPPDYAAAARTQGGANLQAAIAQNVMGRPTEITPYGTRRWGETGQYTVPAAEGNPAVNIPLMQSNIEFSPLGQERFGQEERITRELGGVAEAGIGRVGQAVAQPFNMAGVPGAPGVPQATEEGRRAVVNALLERSRPEMERRREAQETALVTRGHTRGGPAWQAAQQDLSFAENDALRVAELAGGAEQSRLFGIGAQQYGMGTDARSRAIQEQAYMRQLPLNELSALRSGSQMTPPQFQPYGSAGIQAAPMYNAALQAGQYGTDVYNAQQAAANAQSAGLFGLGAGALSSMPYWGPMVFSDRRLKSAIRRIGTHPLGIGLYHYRIFGREEIGVMADEVLHVKPETVTVVEGYLAVDYGRL